MRPRIMAAVLQILLGLDIKAYINISPETRQPEGNTCPCRHLVAIALMRDQLRDGHTVRNVERVFLRAILAAGFSVASQHPIDSRVWTPDGAQVQYVFNVEYGNRDLTAKWHQEYAQEIGRAPCKYCIEPNHC